MNGFLCRRIHGVLTILLITLVSLPIHAMQDKAVVIIHPAASASAKDASSIYPEKTNAKFMSECVSRGRVCVVLGERTMAHRTAAAAKQSLPSDQATLRKEFMAECIARGRVCAVLGQRSKTGIDREKEETLRFRSDDKSGTINMSPEETYEGKWLPT